MHVSIDTTNREAFELVTDALESLDEYRASGNVDNLDFAASKLRQAQEKDPSYVRARYYEAIVDDLSGRYEDAAMKFRRLLTEPSPLTAELHYNLGVAEYHGYNHEALERARREFSNVLNLSNDQALRLHAEAGLAQTHAMNVIPKEADKPDLEAMQHHYDASMRLASGVLEAVRKRRPWYRLALLPNDREVAAVAYNAQGMALQAYSDYATPEKRFELLDKAIDVLDKSDELAPNNWATYCNMASARMRLAYHKKDNSLFEEALELLRDVMDRLRPGYPFAKYEVGRIYRMQGKFSDALECFQAVVNTPRDQRDISDRRPKKEIDRALAKDTSFP